MPDTFRTSTSKRKDIYLKKPNNLFRLYENIGNPEHLQVYQEGLEKNVQIRVIKSKSVHFVRLSKMLGINPSYVKMTEKGRAFKRIEPARPLDIKSWRKGDPVGRRLSVLLSPELSREIDTVSSNVWSRERPDEIKDILLELKSIDPELVAKIKGVKHENMGLLKSVAMIRSKHSVEDIAVKKSDIY